ncbi:MAG TPA: S41 family peptidase [Chitinophagales bacterium]|nr:S41 family peptidase [Chitinophagales bacterium]
MRALMKVSFVIVCLFSLNISYAQSTNDGARKYNDADKFVEIMNLVKNYYTDSVDEGKIVDDAIRKALEDLDPHSSYVPAKDVKRSEEGLVGNFEGIGITFQLLRDTILVLEVIPSGPSEKVGLQAGDKIIKVNDTTVAGVKIDNEGVIHKLRGPKGTKVNVSILRAGEHGPIEFTITRDKIPIYSITSYYMAAPGVGYIRLERFSATTMQEFMQAVDKLRAQGMTDLIFDLQGNVGGYLYTAVDLCDQFLGDNQLIVYTQGLHAPYQPYFSNNRGMFQQGKVVLMIDEGSASAAEILSGCLQDNDRALLVGRRTFGKGLVQKPFTLTDGSEVKLTTAHYFTPSGRCIQKPYTGGDIKDYREDYKDRLESGELFGTDTFKFPDSLHFHTHNGRDVYGGGGIKPDVFVPYDTSGNSGLLNQLLRKGVENKFCLEYVERNRTVLNHLYPTGDDFFNNYSIDDNIMAQYMAAAVNDSAIKLPAGVKATTVSDYLANVENDSIVNFKRDYEKSLKVMKARLKANIGRNLFDAGMFYRVINATINNVYAKALEVMQSNMFEELKPKPVEQKEEKKEKHEKPKKKLKVTNDK